MGGQVSRILLILWWPVPLKHLWSGPILPQHFELTHQFIIKDHQPGISLHDRLFFLLMFALLLLRLQDQTRPTRLQRGFFVLFLLMRNFFFRNMFRTLTWEVGAYL